VVHEYVVHEYLVYEYLVYDAWSMRRCVLTSTFETYSTYLSSATSMFSRDGVSTSLYVPLVPAQIGVSGGGFYTQDYSVYNVTGFMFRSIVRAPILSSTARIGYWNASGSIVYTTIVNRTMVLIEDDLFALYYESGVTAIGLPYEDTSRVFTTIHDLYNVSVGVRASIIDPGANMTLVG